MYTPEGLKGPLLHREGSGYRSGDEEDCSRAKVTAESQLEKLPGLACSRVRGRRLSVRAPLNPTVHHSTIVLRGLRGPLIRPTLCRETPVSRNAVCLIAVVFSVYKVFRLRQNIDTE